MSSLLRGWTPSRSCDDETPVADGFHADPLEACTCGFHQRPSVQGTRKKSLPDSPGLRWRPRWPEGCLSPVGNRPPCEVGWAWPSVQLALSHVLQPRAKLCHCHQWPVPQRRGRCEHHTAETKLGLSTDETFATTNLPVSALPEPPGAAAGTPTCRFSIRGTTSLNLVLFQKTG